MNALRVVTLVSVDNQRFTSSLAQAYADLFSGTRLNHVFVLLDVPERHNIRFLQDGDVPKPMKAAKQKGSWTGDRLREGGGEVATWEEFVAEIEVGEWISKVSSEYQQNVSFRDECVNTVYRNLQPKLDRLGIERSDITKLEEGAEYLVEEIGLKLALIEDKMTVGEVAPFGELQIVVKLLEGRYQITPPELVEASYLRVQHDGERIRESLLFEGGEGIKKLEDPTCISKYWPINE